ncbi:formylmethanofuran dehydrogenase [Azospirillum sp. ST 5-10]|uniref:formylmethanofuran dehydrogenase n=1 Tax=unclassified Azospirillum TaxID=2630922 RepID=UPI003F49E82E
MDSDIAFRGATATCPFCGLLCDDLPVDATPDGPWPGAAGCPVAAEGLARWSSDLACAVGGAAATQADAVAAAAALLRGSRRPLFAGLGVDVAAQQAVLALADRAGGVVDHGESDGHFRNLSVLQDTGAMSVTLGEARTRADLVVLVGPDTVRRFPRLLERLRAPPERGLVCLGWTPEGRDLAGWTGAPPEVIPADLGALPDLAAALRAAGAGRRLGAEVVAGVPRGTLDRLAARLTAARYGVVAWAAGAFAGAAPELAVQGLVELIRDVNRTTRCAGLPLGGTGNLVGAHQVSTWQSGCGLRSAFTADGPLYDPDHNGWRRVLAAGEADLLVWTAALGGPPVPAPPGVPVIAVAAPGTAFAGTPAVVLAAARPGLDHDAWAFRTDGVVALRLRAPAPGGRPSAAALLMELATAVQGPEVRHAD